MPEHGNRKRELDPLRIHDTLSPVGGVVVGEGSPFCSPERGRTCKDGRHTFACQSRESLAKNVTMFLRDKDARKKRAAIVRDFGPITEMDLFVGFTRWYGQRQVALWDATDAETHIAIHRGISSMSDFLLALRLAERILADDALLESDAILEEAMSIQTKTGRPIGDIVRELSKGAKP